VESVQTEGLVTPVRRESEARQDPRVHLVIPGILVPSEGLVLQVSPEGKVFRERQDPLGLLVHLVWRDLREIRDLSDH